MRAALTRLLTLVLIGVTASAISQAASGDMRSHKLAPGDRIMVTVFGQAELSGDFPIDGAGNIQMPLVGAIPVGWTTIEECQQRLMARLADGFLRNPGVTVRIIEFRPIYVLGDVRAPGSYPFRFGLSGLSAIALAGGVGSAEVRQSTAIADLLAAEERVRVMDGTRQGLIVHLARLEAERNGKSVFEIPEIGDAAGNPDGAALVQEEQAQLATALKAHELAIGLLRRQQPRVQTEIDATQEQIGLETRQLRVNQTRLKEYGRLSKLGLGRMFTELELQSLAVQRELNISRLNAELARLHVNLGDLDIRVEEAESARQLRIANELRETRLRFREIEASLLSAREVLELRQQQAGVIAGAEGIARSYGLLLTRGETGRLRPVAVDEDVALEPGDILEVRRLRIDPEPDPERTARTETCDKRVDVSCSDRISASLTGQGNRQNPSRREHLRERTGGNWRVSEPVALEARRRRHPHWPEGTRPAGIWRPPAGDLFLPPGLPPIGLFSGRTSTAPMLYE